MRYAMAERELADFNALSLSLPKSPLSAKRHSSFTEGLTLSPQFKSEVIFPTSLTLEGVFAALVARKPLEIQFQERFTFKVVGDDCHWTNGGKEIGFNGMLPSSNEDGTHSRKLLIEMSEMARTIQLTPLSIFLRPEDATYAQKHAGQEFVPWSFDGAVSYGGYSDMRAEHSYRITVDELTAYCTQLSSSD